jgi:hypothetical protein
MDISDDLAVCVFAAAKTYSVPPAMLFALLDVESHITPDKPMLGKMHINIAWMPQLSKLLNTPETEALNLMRNDDCTNIGVGAWILSTVAAEANSFEEGLARYPSAARHDAQITADNLFRDKVLRALRHYEGIKAPE